MKKFLLTLVAAIPAITMTAAPEESLYIIGLNGVNDADTAMALAFDENRSEDDIDEGVFRYGNPEITISEAAPFTIVTADKSFSLGYDPDNFIGASNDLSATSPLMYLKENGEPINCSLSEGRYSVSLVLFSGEDDPEFGDSWMLQFTSLDAPEDNGNFYLIGFGGEEETPSSANKFVKTVTEEEGETVVTYSIQKFYIGECPAGFTVYDMDNGVNFGGDGEVTDEMPFAMLSEGGSPTGCALTNGYYSVNFVATGGFSMISFMLCEDQTPADEAEYYLLGFNGIYDPTDAVKFQRTVETLEYEDEGETFTETVISYKLQKFEINSCEEGFIVSTASGDFSFGLDPDYAPIFGTSVTQGISFLGLYGAPVGWGMENGVYDIALNITEASTAIISFEINDDNGVDSVFNGSDATPIYYNLQGVRVDNPQGGIFIRRRGGNVSKVIIR